MTSTIDGLKAFLEPWRMEMRIKSFDDLGDCDYDRYLSEIWHADVSEIKC